MDRLLGVIFFREEGVARGLKGCGWYGVKSKFVPDAVAFNSELKVM